jgi:prolyl 4-hydroxylase
VNEATNNATTNATANGGIRHLNAQWQDWLTNNIVAGCTTEALMQTMKDSGFALDFAEAAIAVVRAMTERVQASNPDLLQDFKSAPLNLPRGAEAQIVEPTGDTKSNTESNKVRVADREMNIVFTLNNPNVAVIDGLLSEQECDKLIQFSSGKLKRSEVIERDSGGHQVSKVRTSEGTHFSLGENAVVERLEKRIQALIGAPIENGEPLQILHYGLGGEYLPHHDYFDPKDPGSSAHIAVGGQRVATMVIYLNDVQQGGGTAFPDIEMTVRPKKGSAVYFEYCNANGDLDVRLLHAGLPVIKGDKWIATKWIRQRRYGSTE